MVVPHVIVTSSLAECGDAGLRGRESVDRFVIPFFSENIFEQICAEPACAMLRSDRNRNVTHLSIVCKKQIVELMKQPCASSSDMMRLV